MDIRKPQSPEPTDEAPDEKSDDVIRIEDLAPRDDVRGGRKIVLGEIVPDLPASSGNAAE
jgi:hypothetical protein